MHVNTHTLISSSTILRVFFLCTVILIFNSCQKDLLSIPTNIANANFGSATYTIPQHSTDPFTINIPLSLPAEEEGTIVISIGENGTATSDQFKTNPALASGNITVSVPRDAIEASFTVTSENNFADDVSVEFVIKSTTGGIKLGSGQLNTFVTMKGNNPTTPEISTSTTSIESFGSVGYSEISDPKSFTVSSRNLTENVLVKASNYFEVSLDDITYSESVDINFNNTNLLAAQVYARFKPESGLNKGITGTLTVSTPQVTEPVLITVSGQETGNLTSTFFLNEDFEYGSTGGDLRDVSAPNWTLQNASTTRPVMYIPEGLSLPGFPSTGGAVTMNNGSNCNVMRTFESQSSGTIYTSVMVNITAAPTGSVFFFSHILGGTYYNRLYARDNAGTLELGIARAGTDVAYAPKSLSYNTTYLVVIKYNFTTEESSIFIVDGSIPSLEEPATADGVSTVSTAPSSLEAVIIRQSTGIFTAPLDGIRVSTSWRGAVGY
jgi:hypothetical protein